MKNIFITGATGFLGSYLLKRFLDDADVCPIVLARAKKDMSAEARVLNTLKYFYGEKGAPKMLKRIKVVEGDVSFENCGMDESVRKSLIEEVDEIYHSAAIAEFRVPLETIRRSNVKGAMNVFDFALECADNDHFNKVNHISTTFTAGTKVGIYYENELKVGQGFHNTYEQSKYEAEILAHEYMAQGLKITIFRPSILSGDYQFGKTSNFKMLYQPLHFFAGELFDALPATASCEQNLMPVDSAADAIYRIANEKDVEGRTFHISNTKEVTFGHFMGLASDFFGFKKPDFVKPELFNMDNLSIVQRRLIEPYIPYFNYNLKFDCTKALAVLKRCKFTFPEITDSFLIKLFSFCAETGFIKPKRQYVTAE